MNLTINVVSDNVRLTCQKLNFNTDGLMMQRNGDEPVRGIT